MNTKYTNKEVDPKYYGHIETLNVNVLKSKDDSSIIYAPFIMSEHTEESRKEYNEFMDKYYAQHCCCPNCGSKNYITTLAGYILDMSKPEEYEDRNACHCQDCGWKGVAHELVPENTDA